MGLIGSTCTASPRWDDDDEAPALVSATRSEEEEEERDRREREEVEEARPVIVPQEKDRRVLEEDEARPPGAYTSSLQSSTSGRSGHIAAVRAQLEHLRDTSTG